mmetsp:Transcript_15527/g.31478  ORF Transcript_15527/g.31478 Transcript_15527/m.31478 type:complete len:306 (-) Transcript_15527:817-1734(-)
MASHAGLFASSFLLLSLFVCLFVYLFCRSLCEIDGWVGLLLAAGRALVNGAGGFEPRFWRARAHRRAAIGPPLRVGGSEIASVDLVGLLEVGVGVLEPVFRSTKRRRWLLASCSIEITGHGGSQERLSPVFVVPGGCEPVLNIPLLLRDNSTLLCLALGRHLLMAEPRAIGGRRLVDASWGVEPLRLRNLRGRAIAYPFLLPQGLARVDFVRPGEVRLRVGKPAANLAGEGGTLLVGREAGTDDGSFGRCFSLVFRVALVSKPVLFASTLVREVRASFSLHGRMAHPNTVSVGFSVYRPNLIEPR